MPTGRTRTADRRCCIPARAGAALTAKVPTRARDIPPPHWLDLDVPDDRFVASTLLQPRHPGSAICVATRDINLQTKLAVVGLPFIEAP